MSLDDRVGELFLTVDETPFDEIAWRRCLIIVGLITAFAAPSFQLSHSQLFSALQVVQKIFVEEVFSTKRCQNIFKKSLNLASSETYSAIYYRRDKQ